MSASLVIQIILEVLSAALFVVLLKRGFFPGQTNESDPVFDRIDLFLAISLSLLFAILAFGLFTTPEGKPFSEKDLLPSLVTQSVFGAVVVVYLAIRKMSLRQFFGVGRSAGGSSIGKLIGLGVALMIGLFPLINWITSMMNAEPSQEQEAVKFFRTTSSLQGRILLAFMAVVVAPIVEEMVFRGLLYRIFRGFLGRIPAMVFVSLLFASIHGNLPTFLPLTLLATALTAGLELRGSLVVNIAMHATFNAASLVFMLLAPAP